MNEAILLVGHGTRDETGQRQFLQLAEQLRAAAAPTRVEVAYIELQSPTIDEALLSLHRQGIEKVTLSPALLFAAGHAKQDIPAAVSAARGKAPELVVKIAEPLGCHEAIVELAARRFSTSYFFTPVLRGEDRGKESAPAQTATIPFETPISRSEMSTLRTALVLIGRGSSDPTAIAHCREFAARLSNRTGCQSVFTGFIAIAEPSLSTALEQAATSGAEQIVVQSHLLFSGEMLGATAAAVAAMQAKFPHLAWRLADSLAGDILQPGSAAADYLVRTLQARLAETSLIPH